MLAQLRACYSAGLITILIIFSVGVCSAAPAKNQRDRADAGDVIKSGLAAYEKGQLATATQQLTYALQLVNQKYGDLIAKQMPTPLKGWKAGKVRLETSAMMLGGGISATQEFSKGKGEVEIQVLKDSPLLQSLMMVMNNPMMMGMDGGRMQQIHGYNALIKYKDRQRRGELSLIVENRFLILMKSKQASEDELLAYAEAINFSGLKKLLN